MNTIRKRLLSLFLCFVLIAGMLPVGAFATETGEAATPEITEVTETLTQTASETEELSESTETSEEESEQTDVSKKDEKEAEKAEKKGEKEAQKEEKESEKETETSTEPSSEATEPSSEPTEPSSEPTEASSEPTDPVVIPVTGITLDQTALEVGVGELPMTLTATVLPEDATDKTVTWESSEPGVVSVENGVLTFGYMGEAVITATAGGFSASCTVKVGEGEWDTWEGGTVVIAGSDYQNTNGGAFSDVTTTGAYKIMSQIAEDYPTAYGFLFGGDYYAHSTNTTTESTAGKKQLKEEIVDVLYPNMADETQIYIQGNHDADSLTTNGTLATSGAHDSDYYGVYVINEKDYMWYNDDQTTIKNTASALESYLDAKLEAGYSKPIFVLSHLPLHYSNRTINEGDGKYAKYIYDVLDAAGDCGLNIIFMYGHNHSTSYYEEYLGNAAVYLAEGDTIYIANEGSKSSCFSDKLTFTYMNYGFTGYLTGTAADGALTMTVFEITDSQVSVKRYDENGVHNLKSAGTNGSTPSGATYNSTVYASPQTITLTTPALIGSQTQNGVTVSGPGVTGLTVTKQFGTHDDNVSYDSGVYSAYASYDIAPVGYVSGSTATVTITLDAADGFDSAKPVVVIDKASGSTKTVSIENGTVTFETSHFSVYDVAQYASIEIEIPGESGSSNIWRKVDSMTAGKTYMLVNYGDNASGVGTYAINSTAGGTSVTVLTDSTSAYIENTNMALAWTYNSNAELTNAETNWHLYIANSPSGSNGVNVGVTQYVTTGRSYSSWKLATNTGVNEVSLSAYRNGSSNYYPARWSNGGAEYLAYTSTQTSKHDNWIAVFEQVVGTSTEATKLTVTLDKSSGIVRQDAGVAAITGSKLTLTYEDGTTETVNVTVGMLRDADGNTISTETAGTHTDLSVVYTYNGKEYTICDNYTLTVRENVQNNYPDYPDEGAVKVNKTATGIDFQSSGIAQVEVSASGVPSKKGVDVIVMVDTSSSMKRGAGTNEEVSAPNRRIDFLQTAIANLIREFQAVGEDGEQLDVKVAIAEFNGYDFISGEDEPSDTNQQGAENVAEVFTGDNSTGVGAFVQATTITNPDAFAANIGAHSGTNYDYAFDTVYRLGSAINAQNAANNEERDLFVIFMSDGAPYGYNYYGSGTTDTWDDYLNGNMTKNYLGQIVDDTDVYLKGNTHFYRTDGKHWMAEAVKGTTDQTYMVIDPTDSLGTDASTADVAVYEDSGIILTEGETDYFRMVPGLGAEVHTIGFCLYDDNQGGVNIVTDDTQKALMQRLASTDSQDNLCYHETESGDDLNDIFCEIASQIAYAASNARFVDQMGSNFNLQMETVTYTVVNDDDTTTQKTLTPKIEIISYDIYTRQDYLDGTITEDKIGDRKGTYTILETVTFTDDGQGNVIGAYSDQIDGGKTNILADGTQEGYVKGVIYAKTFLYNTNTTEVAVDGVNIPTGKNSANLTTGSTNVLPKETFYWKMGTVQTSELAMRYYVYLDGSMEGTKQAGSYPTNNFATLYYDNYLGNPCYKDTVSPVMAWKEANVSYAFYLVNENGEIIVNQTTGQTGSFANKIAVTNPVVYETVLLNNDEEVSSIDIASLGVLPEGYTLYDYDGTKGATYTVTINSNTTGGWNITSVKDVATTYVMQYDPNDASAYSIEKQVSEIGYDYTHTVVWFAVLWKVQALPDSVVVDYGLPVDISVLGNDMFGENGQLAGVGAYSEGIENTTAGTSLESGFGADYTGTYGTAKADTSTGKVRYTLNTMEMPTYEKFAYAVNYTGSENAGYYYDTVTVIPATTIYYEDSFLRFAGSTSDGQTTGVASTVPATGPVPGQWYLEGEAQYAIQDEDRPGKYSLTDANNIYGYDSVNKGMSTFSLGSAAKVHVDANSYATAEFTFMGTGFDVISMTSGDTGLLKVQVWEANADGTNGTQKRNTMVNTYYGYTSEDHYIKYTYDGEMWTEEDLGTSVQNVSEKPENPKQGDTYIAKKQVWVVNPEADSALYQIPVIKIEDLDYKKYNVKITAAYNKLMDVANQGAYDLYLDAIRIYDPANDGAQDDDTVIEDAYKADGEGWPSYVELRNGLIDNSTLGNAETDTVLTGLVFIDGDEEVGDAQIADYISYGPNNEVYLAPGQRVAFKLDLAENAANVHIGIKSADGQKGTYTITNVAAADKTVDNTTVSAGTYYGARTASIDTTTDMYYDLTGWKNDIIVISNTGDREEYNTSGIISLTNIKFTYTSDPGENEAGIYITPKIAMLTLRSLNAPVEEEIPEETTPNETMPGETVPETTEPDVTEPEETEPEETKPDKESEKIQKEIEKALKKAAKELQKAAEKAAKALSKLFGSWF